VSFFAYPGRASDLVPAGCPVTVLADRDQDVEAALDLLADQVAPGHHRWWRTPCGRRARRRRARRRWSRRRRSR